MAVATVNISFQEDLLGQIDKIAKNEARTRSELILKNLVIKSYPKAVLITAAGIKQIINI